MAKRILSISLMDDSFQYLEAERQPAGYFPRLPPTAITNEALMSACRKADEIYINGLFPTAIYERELFPKVARRYLQNLVIQDARQKHGAPTPLQVRLKTVGETLEAGAGKWEVAYIAVEEDYLDSIWNTFKDFTRKIKFLTPLPVALASMIGRIDHPSDNFVVVCVDERSSVIAISGAGGVVKVARSVPIGLPKKGTADAESLKFFAQDLAKELSMTATFFKQQFREPVPKTLYLLGNNSLPQAAETLGTLGSTFDIRYRLTASPVQGMSDSQANELFHLVANFYLPEDFNFIPGEELVTRRTDVAFRAATAALLALILLGGLWAVSLVAARAQKIGEHNGKLSDVKRLQQQVQVLRGNVNQLRPFEGWKELYEGTFKDQPRWDMFLSELAMLIPPSVVIEHLQVAPEKGPQGLRWNSRMIGKVQAKDWQEGLRMIREFGATVHASPLFDVNDVDYAPEEMQAEAKTFGFEISFRIVPEGRAHEI